MVSHHTRRVVFLTLLTSLLRPSHDLQGQETRDNSRRRQEEPGPRGDSSRRGWAPGERASSPLRVRGGLAPGVSESWPLVARALPGIPISTHPA